MSDPTTIDARPNVLLIAGWGRSGSTILGSILGQIDGFFDAGEIHNLWQRGVVDDRPCSCGVAFSACPIWSAVFEEAFGGVGAVDGTHLVHLAQRMQTLGVLSSLIPGRRDALMAAESEYVELLGRLYDAIRRVTGCSVIVDSSKKPCHGFVVANMPSIDVSVLHLVRDPRGVAHSWMKSAPYDPDTSSPSSMLRYSPAHSTAIWASWNAGAAVIGRSLPYRFVRYEDFMANPTELVHDVAADYGLGHRELPFVDDRTVVLAPTHNPAGNPSRFANGRVELRVDDEWKRVMRRRDRGVVTSLVAPFMWRYGYLGPDRRRWSFTNA